MPNPAPLAAVAVLLGSALFAGLAAKTEPEAACRLKITDSEGHIETGIVVRFVGPEEAERNVLKTEVLVGGPIDPDYIAAKTKRVRIRPDRHGGQEGAVVPRDMKVTLGQRVEYLTLHRNAGLSCHYFPNLIININPGEI